METIDKKEIQRLLERYFEGMTSLQEEKKLRDYFIKGNIDSEFLEYAPMFSYFAEEIVVLKEVSEEKIKSQNIKFNFKFLYIAAAAAIVAFTFILWPSAPTSEFKLMIDGVSVNNSELAISKADDELSKLNSLMAKVEQSSSSLDRITRVGNALSSINRIEGLYTNSKSKQ